MGVRRFLLIAAALGMIAAPARADDDAFIAMIDAGRAGVFVDRIETAMKAMPETAPAAREGDQAMLDGARDGLRQSALQFAALRAQACREGKWRDLTCKAQKLPRWLDEAPEKSISAKELTRRTEALQADMQDVLAAACESGRAATEDEMFCSVE